MPFEQVEVIALDSVGQGSDRTQYDYQQKSPGSERRGNRPPLKVRRYNLDHSKAAPDHQKPRPVVSKQACQRQLRVKVTVQQQSAESDRHQRPAE